MSESAVKILTLTDHPFDLHHHKSHELVAKGKEALDWLREHGGSVRADRYHSYIKSIENFGQHGKSPDTEEEFYKFLNAHSETNELIRVYDALQASESSSYQSSLRKIASGSVFRGAVVHQPERDFLYELSVAARILRAGYEINLNELADITTNVDGRKVYVEVKRVKSKAQLGKRISEANKQLVRRISQGSSSKSVGFSAVGITDILNPDNSMAFVEEAELLRKNNADLLHSFVIMNDAEFHRGMTNRCMGVLADFSMQGMQLDKVDGDIRSARLMSCRVSTFRRYANRAGKLNVVDRILPGMANQALF